MKNTLLAALLACMALPSVARAADIDIRSQGYLNFTEKMDSDSTTMTLMPGFRTEWTGKKDMGLYMSELYLGPTFHLPLGPLKAHVGVWYYLAAIHPGDADTAYQHSLLLTPAVDLTIDKLKLSDRLLFQNAFANTSAKDTIGYGMIFRNLVQAKWQFTEKLAGNIGWEPYIPVTDGGEEAQMIGGTDWSQHRLQFGIDYALSSFITLSPQYVIEFGNGTAQYVSLTIGFNTDLF